MSNGSSAPGSTQTPRPDDPDAPNMERLGYDAAYEAGYERGYQSGFKAGTDVGQKIVAKQEYARGHQEGYEKGYNAKKSTTKLKKEKAATERKSKSPGSRKKPK
jgi:flagellar biosynthesis/type III secretory pathway protein FliH